MSKFSKKQTKELGIVEWFIPSWCDWKHPNSMNQDTSIGIRDIVESPAGVSPEEAFFMRSERGVFPNIVTDKSRLRALLWGKVWRERHLFEIWPGGELLPHDFLDEPDYVREFVFTKFFNLPADWKPHA